MRSLALSLLLPLLALPMAATAQDASVRFVPVGREVRAPLGYTEMCADDPALCRRFRAQPGGGDGPRPRIDGAPAHLAALLGQPTAAVALPPLANGTEADAPDTGPPDEAALLRLVHTINAHVNRHVFQQTDQQIYGRPEVWRPAGAQPGATGDCEDIALEKRLELLAAHVPAERLFMAVVYSHTAGLHAVLVARLADGDVVLDSRVNVILPWASSGYDWLSVESPQDPDRWFAVKPTG